MKTLIIINGTMGVGKSTVSKELNQRIQNSVWLDGDWCWMMNPWNFSEENKIMVLDNICCLLENFLKNTSFEYIIFSWVLHYENILDFILERLKEYEFRTCKITLTCSEQALINRMKNDGRNPEGMKNSIDRLGLYHSMDTERIDSSDSTVESIVERISKLILNDRAMY
ncbi:MAG TPA: AAA family ATPase [Syntrophomonadaceae bacterium]|nr:AAA family ATPase [Syntrophomonadaceae bacterium]